MLRLCRWRAPVSVLSIADEMSSEKLSKALENSIGTSTTLWQELPDSFVSNEVGGGPAAAKL